MGMFDSIYFKCPNCKKEIEAQSKSGDRVLASYDHRKVETEVAEDANRHAPFKCDCGKSWKFTLPELPEPPDPVFVNLPIEEVL